MLELESVRLNQYAIIAVQPTLFIPSSLLQQAEVDENK